MVSDTENTFIQRAGQVRSEIESYSSRINAKTIALEDSIERLDTALVNANLGFEFWVHLSEDDRTDYAKELSGLGFSKFKGRWGITIKRTLLNLNTSQGPEEEIEFLRNASRREKLLSAKFLTRLLIEIKARLNVIATETESTQLEVAALADVWTQPKGLSPNEGPLIALVPNKTRRAPTTGGAL